jgi:hypothetical protein
LLAGLAELVMLPGGTFVTGRLPKTIGVRQATIITHVLTARLFPAFPEDGFRSPPIAKPHRDRRLMSGRSLPRGGGLVRQTCSNQREQWEFNSQATRLKGLEHLVVGVARPSALP